MAFSISGQDDQDSDQSMTEINMIPLVDVMLVLLIIFMVTAPLSIGGIKLDLPSSKATGGSQLDEKKIVLSITGRGEVFIDKLMIPQIDLEAKLKAIFEHRSEKEIYIRADTKVAYGKVIEAMSAAKLAGVSRMNMLTQPPTATRAKN